MSEMTVVMALFFSLMEQQAEFRKAWDEIFETFFQLLYNISEKGNELCCSSKYQEMWMTRIIVFYFKK